MIKVDLKFNKESDGQHSYILSFTSDKNKDKYADIEFVNDGEILTGKTDRINPSEIKTITTESLFDVLEDLIKFMNKD
jgi:hypothetical protein